MEFIINGTKWTIEEAEEATINNETRNDCCLGLTNYKSQKILLLKNQPNILKTLIHELTHVWLYEYGHNQVEKQFNYEDVCEIVASCYKFMEAILEDYKKKMLKDIEEKITKEE